MSDWSRHRKALDRRLSWLQERVSGKEMDEVSYDRSEAAALRFAVAVIEAARERGALPDLEVWAAQDAEKGGR